MYIVRIIIFQCNEWTRFGLRILDSNRPDWNTKNIFACLLIVISMISSSIHNKCLMTLHFERWFSITASKYHNGRSISRNVVSFNTSVHDVLLHFTIMVCAVISACSFHQTKDYWTAYFLTFQVWLRIKYLAYGFRLPWTLSEYGMW